MHVTCCTRCALRRRIERGCRWAAPATRRADSAATSSARSERADALAMAPVVSQAMRTQLHRLRFRVFNPTADSETHEVTDLLDWDELQLFCARSEYGPGLRLQLSSARNENLSRVDPDNLPRVLDVLEGTAPLPKLSARAPAFRNDVVPKARRERLPICAACSA